MSELVRLLRPAATKRSSDDRASPAKNEAQPPPSTSLAQEGSPIVADAIRPTYLSLIEAADYLGITPAGVRKFIASGQLPAYRLGKRPIRIRLEDLDGMFTRIPAAS